MAHRCLVCDSVCHCGGDLDDFCFDDPPAGRSCSCCSLPNDNDDDFYDYNCDYYDDKSDQWT